MKTKKVIINNCYGKYSLSLNGGKEYLDRVGIEYSIETNEWGESYLFDIKNNKPFYSEFDDMREDETLIECLEELGSKYMSGNIARLEIVEIPDDVEYYINSENGLETIHEKHRKWGGLND